MATAARIQAIPPRIPRSKVDYQERCRCGHYRYEHNHAFGCMQWDERRPKGWCDCDGFAVRRMYLT
jgi:hypothetical protein